MPYLFDSEKVQLEYLLYSLKSKDLFMLFSIVVLQTLIGNFHKRLKNI